uniref:Uncharacterized protein n=1 Tax=Rhizophora mucronata TaxID=61149 RepID=A0A2P2QMT5_RHIMU
MWFQWWRNIFYFNNAHLKEENLHNWTTRHQCVWDKYCTEIILYHGSRALQHYQLWHS